MVCVNVKNMPLGANVWGKTKEDHSFKTRQDDEGSHFVIDWALRVRLESSRVGSVIATAIRASITMSTPLPPTPDWAFVCLMFVFDRHAQKIRLACRDMKGDSH